MKTIIKKSKSLLICSIFFISVMAYSCGIISNASISASEIPSELSGEIIKQNENWTVIKYNNSLHIEHNGSNGKISEILTYPNGFPVTALEIKNTMIAVFRIAGSGRQYVFYAVNYDAASNSLISQCFEGCSYAVWLQDGFKGGISLNGAEYEGEFSGSSKENMCKNGTYTDSGVLLEESEHGNIEKSLYSLIIADGSSIKTLRDVTDKSSGYTKFGAVEIIYNIEDDGSITQQPAHFYTLDQMASMSWRLMSRRP